MLEEYKNKKILIAGFGIEGRATFEYFKQNGIHADIADMKEEADFYTENPDLRDEEALFFFGKNYLAKAENFDVVFRSPGISIFNKDIVRAKQKNTKITSQIKFFMEACPALTIGVTGTKGKGTTSTLIYQILKRAGKKSFLGGNIGTPAISFLDQLDGDSVVVLELSSFQLSDIAKSPHVAVVLNITEDHLDYHKNREEYVEAKKSIVRFQKDQDCAVINVDYNTSASFAVGSASKVYEISTSREVSRGCYVNESDQIVLVDDQKENICTFSDLQIRGRHNLENVCSAVCASHIVGADIKSIKSAVKDFKGLEHRLELIADQSGVKYYNDSFATTLETTEAALDSFEESIILIAGGSSKGADYRELGRMIAKKASRAYLIGDTAEEIEAGIKEENPDFAVEVGYTSMDELISKIKTVAQAGDIVLLSPGCASFGLFENYKERGRLFKEAVLLSKKYLP